MEPLTIRELIDAVLRGQIRIPSFQRGFVWEPDRVAYLMDSIYKGYPFGSLLFWRTREHLRAERDLGPFRLPPPRDDYPLDYVLDGQQRVTAIFGVFQTELPLENPQIWMDIYFDFTAERSAQDTQFFALPPDQVDSDRHFPLKVLFDTVAYRRATAHFSDELAKNIDDMQSVFKEARIPIQMFKTEDKATVAIIFERVNRQGVPLDTLQLLSAWTWSEEFQLQEQFTELASELTPFGFEDIGSDTNLLLRCCSAIFSGDASPEALMNLNGSLVRSRFDEVMNGVKGAVDYLRTHFSVERLQNLPFSTVLVPLTVFFAVPGNQEVRHTDEQRRIINRWFWRVAFSKRYSSGVLRNLKVDIEEMRSLRDGLSSRLGSFSVTISPQFFTDNTFGIGYVNTKTFILLLAQAKPLSFISGAPIDLSEKLRVSNRTEFHHLMPKAFLERTGQRTYSENCLANFAFMSRADNRLLGGDPPSRYREKMPVNSEEILDRAKAPLSLYNDDFRQFVNDRAGMLAAMAANLCEVSVATGSDDFHSAATI
ncbi:MAG: DUF262 domain-containing protein [Bacillota bacterium]